MRPTTVIRWTKVMPRIFFMHRRVRREGAVVLVLADGGLALGRHHADDRERLLLDADHLADRIDVRSEQLIADDRPEHHHLGRRGDVLRREERARFRPATN